MTHFAPKETDWTKRWPGNIYQFGLRIGKDIYDALKRFRWAMVKGNAFAQKSVK
jgi:hypothetical protein